MGAEFRPLSGPRTRHVSGLNRGPSQWIPCGLLLRRYWRYFRVAGNVDFTANPHCGNAIFLDKDNPILQYLLLAVCLLHGHNCSANKREQSVWFVGGN